MAISRDSHANGGWNTSSSTSWTHTCAANADVLVVAVWCNSADHCTGVTYNSISMTQRVKIASASGGHYAYLYTLKAPATGANTVKASFDTTIDNGTASVSYITGGGDYDNKGSQSDTTNQGTYPSTVVSVANNCWMVSSYRQPGGGVVSAGTNLTSLEANLSGVSVLMGDSNGPITPAGSYTMTCDSNYALASWESVGVTIAPAAPAPSAPARRRLFRHG